MATPTVAKNKDRVLNKIIACLIYPSNEADKSIGGATLNHARTRVWVSAGVPSGGTGVATNDICLDTTNDDVYRYYSAAWYKLSVEA